MGKDLTVQECFAKSIPLHKEKEELESEANYLKILLNSEVDEEFVSQEEYVDTKCGQSNPRNKKTNKTKNPGSIIKTIPFLIISIFAIILTIVMFSQAGNMNKQASILRDLKINPGTGFAQWENTWASVDNFDELESTWYLVENDWKAKGVAVSWEDVMKTKEKHFSYVSTIRADVLLERICNDKIESLDSAGKFSVGIGAVLGALVFFVLFIRIERNRIELEKEYNKEIAQNAKYEMEYKKWANEREQAKKDWVKEKNENSIRVEKEKEELVKNKEEWRVQKDKLDKKIASLQNKIKPFDRIIASAVAEIDDEAIEGYNYVDSIAMYNPDNYDSDFLSKIGKGYDNSNFIFKKSLRKYYKDLQVEYEWEQELREQEREAEAERRREREREIREREVRDLEEKRQRSYEREQRENRAQQERLAQQARKDAEKRAKEEADWAAARIRCAQCKFYNTCCSMSKNKKPYAPCFKSK